MFDAAALCAAAIFAAASLILGFLLVRCRQAASGLRDDMSAAVLETETWKAKAGSERETRIELETKLLHLAKCEADLSASRNEVLRLTQACSVFEGQSKRLPDLESEVDALNGQILKLSTMNAKLETSLREQDKSHEGQVQALSAIRGEIQKDLKNIASETLKANETSFLSLANEVFLKHKEVASVEVDAKAKAVDALVAPIAEMLASYQQQIAEMDKRHIESNGKLSSELKNVVETQHTVRNEAAKLANALRAAPKTRGRWGEHTLRNVLELSGLSQFCDFDVEQTIHNESGTIRPDVIIRLPGGRSLVVDAKTSLSAYLDAVECTEEADRSKHLDLHAVQIRNHAKQLGAKSYWDGLSGSPDFVVMFVPGDNFYSAAAERDSELFEFAVAQRVLIVTPATLIALAKAVAYGWRQEKIAENTKAVHDLGRDLYRRLTTMGEHVAGLGKNLNSSVRKFNDFVGSLEGSVLPQARKFNELEVEGTSTPIPTISLVDTEVRESRSRDMLAAPQAGAA